MIKRRFYKHEHDDGDDGPSDSSSSSDSEVEAEATEVTEDEEEDVAVEAREENESSSSGSLADDDALESGNSGQIVTEIHSQSESDAEIAEKDEIPSDDFPDYILKSKSVFKCKLCPKIVCLTEETLRTHLKSKRHARSEKQLAEGRLKCMLESDGELEGETHQERHASTLAAAAAAAEQILAKSTISRKRNKGRQRQRDRLKKKIGEDVVLEKTIQSTKIPGKKRRKSKT